MQSSVEASCLAALEILASEPSGSATIARLKKELPNHLNLSDADRADSPTRNGEQVWEQQVRNLVSHRKTPGNIVAEGYATYTPKRLTITDAGRKKVS